jgi:hypothetical protein
MPEGGPADLCLEPVRDPDLGADTAAKRLDHVLAAARPKDKAGAVTVMEDLPPPILLADPEAGLVGSRDSAGEQVLADQISLPRKGLAPTRAAPSPYPSESDAGRG